MSFFITDAMAQGTPAQPGADFLGFLPLILIFIVFYFLLIRPQVKRAKEHKKMVEALEKGDEVVTGGGLLGKIVAVEDGFVTVEIAHGVEVKVQKNAVASLVPKGTLKGS